jgi:hypothetical protein
MNKMNTDSEALLQFLSDFIRVHLRSSVLTRPWEYRRGSASPASAKPFNRSKQASQRPHDRPGQVEQSDLARFRCQQPLDYPGADEAMRARD